MVSDYYLQNKDRIDAYNKKYMKDNRDKVLLQRRERILKLKITVFSHYCAGYIKCQCCGESNIKFLTLDHEEKGGNEHRKSLGLKRGGDIFYIWVIKNNFPKGLQVLCFNCNIAKANNGNICPHKSSKS